MAWLKKSISYPIRCCPKCGIMANAHSAATSDYNVYRQDNTMMTRRKKTCKKCGSDTALMLMDHKVTPFGEDSLADKLAGRPPRQLGTSATLRNLN